MRRAFRKHGFAAELVHPIRGCEDPWAYRNKVDLTAKTFGGELHLGFLPYGDKHTLVEMEECPIADPAINEAMAGLRRALPRHPDLKKKLISIVCRASRAAKNVGLVFHGKIREPDVYRELAMDAMGECETITGGVFVRKRKEHITGEKMMTEQVRDREFRYSVRAFFQSNPPQTAVLVDVVEELAELTPDDVLLDLYAGVGLFGISFADKVKDVYMLEDTPYSVESAKANVEALGIENAVILRGQAEERVELMLRSGQHPSVIVLDPPRSGLHPSALDAVSRFPTHPRLLYVSCNAETHARDCAALTERGYELAGVWPVDMFPQTLHVEGVALLK